VRRAIGQGRAHYEHTQLDRNHIAELLPLYVSGALDADEMLAIKASLQSQPDLLERLAVLEEVMVHVAQSAPMAPLPSDARVRLLTRVRADLARFPTQAGDSSADKARPMPHAGYQNPLLRRRERRIAEPLPAIPAQRETAPRSPWAARLRWVAIAACLLFAFAMLGVNFFQQGRIRELSAEVVHLTAEVTGLREVNQQIEQQLQERANQLALFMEAERSVALAGTDLAPTAQGAFYLSSDEGIVVLSGLEPLPADRAYQLWLVPPDGTPTSVALLSVPANDLVSQTVMVPVNFTGLAMRAASIR